MPVDNNSYICSFYANGAVDQNNVIHSTPWTYAQASVAAQAYANLINTEWQESWTDPTPLEDTAHPGTRYGVLIGLLSETYQLTTTPPGPCPAAPTGTVLEPDTGLDGDWSFIY